MKTLLLAGAAALVAIPAIAQMAPEKPIRPMAPIENRADVEARVKARLGELDTNKDGIVTREEIDTHVQARMKAHADEEFTAMDADKNGQVSRAEFDARHKGPGDRKTVHIQRRGPGPDGGPPPPPPHMGMMMRGPGGMDLAEGSDRIVIADAVKKALDRFDAADTNKDGVLSPEEREKARDAMREKWRDRRS